ncbi:MAG: hypothetical protein JXA33_26740 [Anaerolineae bacterium]|nr:hypothetical protein [Anaerolineae bacterium]
MKKMKFFRMVALGVLCLLLVSIGGPVLAQSYNFGVPDLKMQVYVQPDASAKIVYDITFDNRGQTIDIVDIGMPHAKYDIDTMRASINGVNLTGIYPSEYVKPGVEIHLEEQSIQYGTQGTLHFEFTMPDMVYQDTTNKENASLQITPTWFDSEFVRGSGNIWIAIHMLEGIQPDEVLYQKTPFTDKALYQGNVAAIWRWENVTATKAYLVGVSFPQRGMERVIKMSLIDLVNKFMEDNPGVRFILGAIAVIGFAFLFFRFSGGTGFTVFVILTAGMVFLFLLSPILHLLFLPFLGVLLVVNEQNLKKQRKTYLPPIAQVEGGGIKRGLTAPEAAVLLEMPMNKVLLLVIFGLLEKGILEHENDDPLTVKVADAYRTQDQANLKTLKERRNFRRTVAQSKGTVVHTYEDHFLDTIGSHPNKPLRDIDFTRPMETLIKATVGRMKGFDLSDTQDYYHRVIDRAMQQASSLGEIEAREQYLDKYMPWVIMNEDYPTVFTHGGYHYWPMWARRAHPVPSGGGQLFSGSKGEGRPSVGGRTSFGDVAASFAGWAETTMGGMAASILPGSMKLPAAGGGIVDLSGVDKVTGDIFEALAKSSSSSGGKGGSGGCACACAGCACACACAGGGR